MNLDCELRPTDTNIVGSKQVLYHDQKGYYEKERRLYRLPVSRDMWYWAFTGAGGHRSIITRVRHVNTR